MTSPIRIGEREFVVMIAALMAINAMAIDIMLPALPAIGASLDIASANDRQWIIAAYMFGFGSMQLFYGPIADRYGRKPVLVITLILFALASVFAAEANDFASIIAARVLQGTMAASTRVLAVTLVRDKYSGRKMARVMSLAQMVFFAVPILAPSLGAVVLLVGSWPLIFYILGGFGALLAIWATLRLPESLDPAQRRPISITSLREAYAATLGNRYSLGYTLAASLMFGGLLGFINSSQQIFGDIFNEPDRFPLFFAAIAFTMGCASFTNSRLVERLGTRRISHTALLALIGISGFHTIVAATGFETLASFVVLQAMTMGAFGLVGANFGSMAMEPLGHIAGTASSVQGFISTVGAATIGVVIGQAFDGTTVPVAAGFLIAGTVALGIVLVVEGGRLFQPRSPAPAI